MQNPADPKNHALLLPASASALVNVYRPPFGAPRIHFEEGGAAPAASAAPVAAADPAASPAASAAPAAAATPAAAAASAPYRPEGLPDHLYGKSEKETIDNLFKAFDGFRKTAGEQGAVPDAADKYTFDASDKLKPYVGNFDKDPVYKATREIAHKAGMTDKVFKGFVPQLLEHLVDSGLVEAPVDPIKMLQAVAPASMAAATDAEKQTAGAKVVRDNIAWVDQMKATKVLPEAAADYLAAQAADAPGAHALIGWLRGTREERRPALNPRTPVDGQTKEQLDARNADPRNDPNSAQFDRKFAEDTRNMFKQANPG